MPYAPKYQLNKRDAERWHLLLTRHCCECPVEPGGKVKLNLKFPPLTPEENVEFEKLCRKRSRKIASHPKVRASIEASRRHDRKIKRLLAKLEHLMQKLKIKVDQ